jgi:6-pyruvoyltetrahydropterin/6-carboxytetrahydropterin synthase
MSVEIVKEFAFDAAHFLPTAAEGHPYRRMHGHSFLAEVALAGTPDPASGWLVDFAVIEAALAKLRDRLDHRTLNDIPGLSVPTLENLAAWLYGELEATLPGLTRVTVRRPSSGESCTYRPER